MTFPKGQVRDYYTEEDANAAIAKHGNPELPQHGCRKQKLSS